MRGQFLVLVIILGGITPLQACAPVIVAGGATAAVAAADRRSVGTQLDDENIELTARRKINDDNRLGDDVHVNITCFNGTMLLTGEATTAEQRDIVVSLAGILQGVKRVVNEIIVTEPTAFASRTNDSWITGRVKAKLLADEKITGRRVKVVTENGAVYLMGLVTQKEGELAAEATRAVGGVKRVVKLFEYTD
ncbi:outer membrane lipoprotein [Sulfuricaulis limicola]|uniref:Outer membrane lipoprotein n=1 Tax=Sulfuricaulis limicola TaxID=1620215 RepID=A0A1B4XDD9_9GAMM|nr:BON domain-containing protein [Sulfuricaulis limicola]BAV32833.1 outer membrane lipoprotein [Sulfuricaulis limicola]